MLVSIYWFQFLWIIDILTVAQNIKCISCSIHFKAAGP